MEEKYLSAMGGHERRGQGQEPRCQGGVPTQDQVLSWVDQVFHELRQNKVRLRIVTYYTLVFYENPINFHVYVLKLEALFCMHSKLDALHVVRFYFIDA